MMRDLCKTTLFTRFLRQAQVSVLEIFYIFLWLIRLRRIAFLELEQKLPLFKGLDTLINLKRKDRNHGEKKANSRQEGT